MFFCARRVVGLYHCAVKVAEKLSAVPTARGFQAPVMKRRQIVAGSAVSLVKPLWSYFVRTAGPDRGRPPEDSARRVPATVRVAPVSRLIRQTFQLRLFGIHRNAPADRALAVQGALGTSQDLDAIDVEQRLIERDGIRRYRRRRRKTPRGGRGRCIFRRLGPYPRMVTTVSKPEVL